MNYNNFPKVVNKQLNSPFLINWSLIKDETIIEDEKEIIKAVLLKLLNKYEEAYVSLISGILEFGILFKNGMRFNFRMFYLYPNNLKENHHI